MYGAHIDRKAITRAVAKLFTNGIGEKAERLVLIDRDGRDLGGWGQEAMVEQILRELGIHEESSR